jgi:hypothetical protein
MNLDYIFVPAGSLLLGVPATVITSAKVKEKLRQPARRHQSGIGSIARTVVNWVDLARAAAGTWMIHRAFTASAGQDELALTFLSVQIGILTLAVLLQTIWLDRPVRLIGPFFFLAGMTLVLCGPMVGAFSIALSMGCALLIKRLRTLFILMPLCLLGFGWLFRELSAFTAFMAAAYVLPAFLSFAMGTRIAFARVPSDASKRPGGYTFPDPDAEGGPGSGVVITPDFSPEPEKLPRESLA